MEPHDELRDIRELLASLTRRVYRLEQLSGLEKADVAPAVATPAAEVPHAAPSFGAPPPSVAPVSHAPAPPLQPPPSPAQSQAPPPPLDGPSLESRIGGQWLNRIGIVAVLIGVSYFLKFAFDNEWIGPAGRIAIGLLAGIGVVFWSERFRSRGFQVFSYSLKAVGVGVLYLSLWAAFHLYALIPAGVAFACMVIVTAATAYMALSQDAEVLAALALVGGFLTPALVSTGQNKEVVLFSYVALLDVAALWLVHAKPWRRLLVGAFTGTALLYFAWYTAFFTPAQMATTLLFASIFWAIFAVVPVVARAIPEVDARTAPAVLILLALANAAVYFLQVFAMLDTPAAWHQWIAWFAVGLAAVYILLARMIAEAQEDSRSLLPMLHTGIAIGFLTIAIPLKLESHWITLGWLAEAGVLFYIGVRTRTAFLKQMALGAYALGIIKLLAIESSRTTQVLFLNYRFLTYVVAIAVLAYMIWSHRDRLDDESLRSLLAAGVVGINVLVLVALCLEVSDVFQRMFAEAASMAPRGQTDWREYRRLGIMRDFTFSAVWMAYGAALMFVGFWKRSAFLRWQAMVLIGATILKVFIYDVSALDRGFRIASFIILGAILLGISFLYQRDILRLQKRGEGRR